MLEFSTFGGIVTRASFLGVVGFGAILSISGAKLTFSTGNAVFKPVLATSCGISSLHTSWALQGVDNTWWAVVMRGTISALDAVEVLTSWAQITVSIELQVVAG